MSKRLPHLGILVDYYEQIKPPFLEKGFYKILSIYGQKLGIQVTVFSPTDIQWHLNKIHGYRYHRQSNTWRKGEYPLPTILYDRIFYQNSKKYRVYKFHIDRLKREGKSVFLGFGLPGKWKVYQMCKDLEPLKPYFPETLKLDNFSTSWKKKLEQYGSLFFKPASGSHGKRVFKLTQTAQGKFYVQGRTAKNKLFFRSFTSFKKCALWVKQFTSSSSFIYQPYLYLSTRDGLPFDIRILVQKNEEGDWVETGKVVRVGKKNSLTSNLHGGGNAVETQSFLRHYYSQQQIEQIDKQLQRIVTYLPPHLEEIHGPLIELGIDVGIDTKARAWILEVNSKPGRKSFRITAPSEVRDASLLAPIRYAKHVVAKYGRSM